MTGFGCATRSGRKVFTPVPHGTVRYPHIILVDDRPFPLGFHYKGRFVTTNGMYTVAADQADGDLWAICVGQGDLTPRNGWPAMLFKYRTGSVEPIFGMGYGQNSVWVTETGLVCGVLKGTTEEGKPIYLPDGTRRHGGRWWSRNGELLKVAPHVTEGGTQGTSQGFAYVENSGSAHFRDHAAYHPTAHPDGRKLRRMVRAIREVRSGDWSVLLETKSDRILVYRHSTDMLYVAWGTSPPTYDTYTADGPLITEQADGSAIISVNQERSEPTGAEHGLFISTASLKLYNVALPREVAPAFLGMCGYTPNATLGSRRERPGNVTWWQPKDSRRVLEGVPWSKSVTLPMEFILFGSEPNEAYPDKDAHEKASIEEAKAHGCGIGAYYDNSVYPASWRARIDRIRKAGVYAFAIVQGYPNGMQDPDQVES